MRFLIITHVGHQVSGTDISAYAPYVREMNLWLNHVDEVVVVAPKSTGEKSAIDIDYKHNNIRFNEIPAIEFTSLKTALRSFFKLPVIFRAIYKACKQADHIHLRCPGNIGLLGCLVQLFFPKKIKTAKYAGNWDPKAKQPLSYKLQKWILSNTGLTKNMSVLVYGHWKNQTKNIKPFFTASFTNNDIEPVSPRNYSQPLKFVFIGTLVAGKRPLLAVQIIENLIKKGKQVSLDVYGHGILYPQLKAYVKTHNLESVVCFHGNQEQQVIKAVLKRAHFLLLPSKSEGWPKAVAEAMFFGTLPIATRVSCIESMLDFGNRGILIAPHLETATKSIEMAMADEKKLKNMFDKAIGWSQKYTLDAFETEIAKLLKS